MTSSDSLNLLNNKWTNDKKEIQDEIENVIRSGNCEEMDHVYDKIVKKEFSKDTLIKYFVKQGKDMQSLEDNFNKYTNILF